MSDNIVKARDLLREANELERRSIDLLERVFAIQKRAGDLRQEALAMLLPHQFAQVISITGKKRNGKSKLADTEPI